MALRWMLKTTQKIQKTQNNIQNGGGEPKET